MIPPVILCCDHIAVIGHGRFEKLFFWATGTNLVVFFPLTMTETCKGNISMPKVGPAMVGLPGA